MLQTFDPKKVNVTYNGTQLRMFGDSLFTLARDEANVSLKTGVKGDSVYVINANKAAKFTIALQQGSPDIKTLEKAAEDHTQAALTVTDSNADSCAFSAENVMVEKTPDRARGKDATDVSIVFLIPELNLT